MGTALGVVNSQHLLVDGCGPACTAYGPLSPVLLRLKQAGRGKSSRFPVPVGSLLGHGPYEHLPPSLGGPESATAPTPTPAPTEQRIAGQDRRAAAARSALVHP